jgi:hypothetical protein
MQMPARMVEAVRGNPVPAALIGAGLTWLLLGTRPARRVERRLMKHAQEAYSEAAEAGREVSSAATQTVGRALGTVAEYAQTGVSALGGAVREGAVAVSKGAQKGYRRSKEAVAETWEEHPLAVGVSLLAAGVATGMLLPATVKESRLIGPAAVDLSRRVRGKGAELVEKGRELFRASGKAVVSEAKRQGLTRGKVGRKVKRVASVARDAVGA